METEFVTPKDVARRLGVRRETVYAWLKSGQLRGIALSRKSGYRIRSEDLDAFLRQRSEQPIRAFERKVA